MKPETIAVHAGNSAASTTRAVIEPITLSTTFERGEEGDYPGGYMYTRLDNPNRKSLERVIAQLENGADACCFASGNAAGNAVFQAVEPGSHVIVPDDMYHGLRNSVLLLFKGVLEVSFADMTDAANVRELIRPNTRLIWMESPSNPLLKISDIEGIVAIARGRGIITACDSTFATPVFQQPVSLGVDLVMHSSTKYLGGHSDVLGGALVTSRADAFWEKIRNIQLFSGAVPSPFDCYLTIRGIKTLPVRMRVHQENALKLASYLEKHSRVERVYYPGLESHAQHLRASRQMSGFSGMLSFLVKGNAEDTRKVVNSVKLFVQATSLGGVESLVEHRASVEGPDTKTPQNLIRVSVGIEHIDDLIADMEQALGSIR